MSFGEKITSDIERKIAGMHVLGTAIGKDLESQGRSNASWTDRTGNTRRAIHGGADKRRNGTTIYLAHGSLVGLFMEEGTNPYVIRPVRKQALHFSVGGRTVFAKKVNHPGITARPVVEPTVASSWPKIKRQVRRYWENT